MPEDGSLEESGGGGESRARPGALHGLMDGVGLSSWRPDNWLRCRPRSRSGAASVLVFARVVRSLDFLGCRFLAASGRLVPFRWNRRGSGATRSFRTRGLASGGFGRRHPPGLSRSGTLHHRRAIRRAAALGARVPGARPRRQFLRCLSTRLAHSLRGVRNTRRGLCRARVRGQALPACSLARTRGRQRSLRGDRLGHA